MPGASVTLLPAESVLDPEEPPDDAAEDAAEEAAELRPVAMELTSCRRCERVS